jgi:hypothetical protein
MPSAQAAPFIAPTASAPAVVQSAGDPFSFGDSPEFSSGTSLALIEAPKPADAVKQRALALNDEFEAMQAKPVITGLAGHIKAIWAKAEQAKQPIEKAMLEALYARRGEYPAEKLAQIQASKQPAIYMMVAAAKMRQVESLLRDVLMGAGGDKPWTLAPTPNPDVPPEIANQIIQAVQTELQQALEMGLQPSMDDARQRIRLYRDQMKTRLMEEAVIRCERMEDKMEDQLLEGGFLDALDQFVSDLATFKTAIIKGPVVRNKPSLKWDEGGDLIVENKLTLQWERVDPFNFYPASWARNIHEGPLIEKHKLTREDLNQMIGVEGYSEAAIRRVLEEYGTTGLSNWLAVDAQKAAAEGRPSHNDEGSELIDALQFWGSGSGQMLRDWGMSEDEVPDATKEYQIEAWLVGSYVIKAVLNADPLARRPYYADSFQRVPGALWGNSPYDLMRDCQDMCNAAARSLAGNLGISSGPQVAILSNRLPAGEDVTEMYPWKIWQFESDPMGSTAAPISFFQPSSNANELMTVYERFSALADEYTGIPRYMAGFNEGSGGAGRTASGMSMMIGNASKIIKQVVGSIDTHVLTKLLERLYYYNMRYSDDEDLKGDVNVVARGAMSLAVKEAAQVRTNEFLQATANPIDMQIVGMEGRAELLRQAAKRLDVNPDKVVPPVQVIKERAAMAQMQQQQIQMQMAQQAQAAGGSPTGNEQTLENGAPVSDHFSPS